MATQMSIINTQSNLRNTTIALMTVIVYLSTQTCESWGHAGSIKIARNSSNKLIVTDLPDEKLLLDPINNIIFKGWINIDLGFDYIQVDDPNNNIFTLQGDHNIVILPVSIGPGAEAINPMTFNILHSGSHPAIHNIPIGPGHLDINWFIRRDVVGTGFLGSKTITLKMADYGTTGYQTSEPFTVHIQNILSPDLDNNDRVDMIDASIFFTNWQQNNCTTPTDCGGADINRNSTVDFNDLLYIIENWLISDPLI